MLHNSCQTEMQCCSSIQNAEISGCSKLVKAFENLPSLTSKAKYVTEPVVKPESSTVPAYTETYVALSYWFSISVLVLVKIQC